MTKATDIACVHRETLSDIGHETCMWDPLHVCFWWCGQREICFLFGRYPLNLLSPFPVMPNLYTRSLVNAVGHVDWLLLFIFVVSSSFFAWLCFMNGPHLYYPGSCFWFTPWARVISVKPQSESLVNYMMPNALLTAACPLGATQVRKLKWDYYVCHSQRAPPKQLSLRMAIMQPWCCLYLLSYIHK